MMLVMGTYSSTEVCRHAGLTYRVLDYWIRCGVIVPAINPTGSGSRRRFSEEQMAHLWVMSKVHDYLKRFVGNYAVATETMASLADALRDGRPWLMGIRVDENGEVETGVPL